MTDRTFDMTLTPSGRDSSVRLDGQDISQYLRGVSIQSNVEGGTSIELIPARDARATLQVSLPEAMVLIADESTPLSSPSTVAVGDRILFDVELLRTFLSETDEQVATFSVVDIQTDESGVKVLALEVAS